MHCPYRNIAVRAFRILPKPITNEGRIYESTDEPNPSECWLFIEPHESQLGLRLKKHELVGLPPNGIETKT